MLVLYTGGIGWKLAHGIPLIYDSVRKDDDDEDKQDDDGKKDQNVSTKFPEFCDTFYLGLTSWRGMEEANFLSTDGGVYNLFGKLPH